MKQNFIREYFSIPNLLGYFRILLIPVYLCLYIQADSTRDYYIAALVMALSFLSDFFDGKIARRFHMITEFGKILDPIADKLTQGTLAISFCFRFPMMKLFLIVFLIKESFLGIVGLYMMHKDFRMNGAQMHGKICTAILDLIMFLILLIPDIHPDVVTVLVFAGIAAMLFSLSCYAKMYYKVWNEKRQA